MTKTLGAIPKGPGEGRTRRNRASATPLEMRELRTAFEILDRNHNGRIYAEDIHHMMKQLGYSIDDESIKSFISIVANGGHCIREHEFLTWMEKQERNQSRHSIIQNAFTTFDRDRDGYINKRDLRDGLKLIGECISDKTLDLMIQEVDIDDDGKLSYKDFSHAMEL